MRFSKFLYPIVFFLLVRPAPAQDRPPAPVVVAEVVEQTVSAGQSFVATVMPLKRAVVGSAVDGRVVELVAQEGQRVTAKEPLARLLTATIELELAAAVAELDFRQHELEELQNGMLPNEIQQAKAKMLAAKANMAYTTARRDRYNGLRASNAASQEDLDESFASAGMAEQNYYDLKAAYELAVAGPRREKIAQATAQVALQQAVADRINDRIKKYTIISQFDGYIVNKFVDEGAWLKSGDPVFEIVALDEVEVQAFVTEQQVPFISRGVTVRVEIPALADRLFTGTVTKIIPQADTRARTFPVKVLVKNEIIDGQPVIKSGMFARVALPTGNPQHAMLVPKDALVLGGPQPVVYVVEGAAGSNSGTAKPVPVELGVAAGNLIQVIGSLKPGQRVVTEGNERLRPGQEVVVK